jgi:DNA repair exonuclease SbcCD nuclease subunit
MLSSLPFSIIAIPGNHDMEAFSSDMNFGDSIEILNKIPFEILEYDDIRIMAVPYANQVFNDLAAGLKESIDDSKINVLVIHCSLDIPYLGEDEYGDEKRQAYLPVNSKVLADIGFEYVFAGHFHSRTIESRLSEKTLFFYSGSPVSISRKEKGRRTAVFLDTKKPVKDRTSLMELDSFYYDDIRMDFISGKEEDILKDLNKRLDGYKGHKAEIEVCLGGFISSGEKDLAQKIKKITDSYSGKDLAIEVKEEYRDIRSVLEDPLYIAFKEKLEGQDLEEGFKKDIEDMVIAQFSRIKTVNK